MRLITIALVTLAVFAVPARAAELTLRAGLVVTWSVHSGSNDYTVLCEVTEASARGFRVNYTFSPPASIRATQFVSADDMRTATWIKATAANGDITQAGQVSLIRISDATFAGLKAGQPTSFNLTGPSNPGTIQKIGEADLPVLVDEKTTPLHAIIGRSPNGSRFWILDNPALPIVLQGDFDWKWTTASIKTSP